ncbi:lipocalin-like domain-containing protein [Rhodococcus sp. HNM0569]|uniref:lipocalin-like domain-containing protein n=1 Tax=Rhodococcus sp. HNM0569 TaxID=2716340 RepID=UPI00146C5D02|nr:lipocalin-like domain-containing protein [Rhodococcus sp. HNM0569]NLU82409.1 carotenoid 1,2-hydratase [Rhodococcus sp. HNM0569]
MPALQIVEAWNGPGRRDGEITVVSPADNGAHPSNDKHAFEHWYFDAHLDDGRIVVAMLQTRELVHRKPGVEIHVYTPDGERREVIAGYRDTDLTVSSQRCDVRIGGNTARLVDGAERPGDLPVYRVSVAEGDLAFDLTFTARLPPWMPGQGRTSYNDREFFAWVVGAPRAAVAGTVTVDGVTTEVTGRGYHDHNWGVGDMKRLIDKWYWGRLYTDDFSLVYAMVHTQRRYGSHWSQPIMLAHGDRIVLSNGEVEMSEGPPVFDPVADRTYPSWLRMTVPGSLELTLTVLEVVHAHNLLEDLPLASSRLVAPLVHRIVGRPGYFRFRSDFALTAHVDGETYDRTGSTLHEMVALS